MEYSFSITPRILVQLGEELIKNESIALLELVKNSYDANANLCKVQFLFADENLVKIVVEDDGDGMDLYTIKNQWLVVGTDHKRTEIIGHKNKRVPLGEKGIGRLGVHKLGRQISLETKTNRSNGVRLNINWDFLSLAERLQDFKISVEEDTSISKTGTRIEISNLKGTWDRRKLRAVYRDLVSLNSPFRGKVDSFRVEIEANSEVFKGLYQAQDILNKSLYRASCRVEKDEITRFEYEFCPWPTLDKIKGRVVKKLDGVDNKLLHNIEVLRNTSFKRQMLPFSLKDYQIGPVDIELYMFEKDFAIFSLIGMDRQILNDYLKENGGVRVYRDDMRVYNYGESDNDWLQLDSQRVGRAGGNISNNMVIGAVSLQRLKSLDLIEKTNREGFIENDAYFALVDAVKYAIDIMVRYRNEDKYRLSAIYNGSPKVVEPVLTALSHLKELVDKKELETGIRDEMNKYIAEVNKQYSDIREILLHSANSGLNLSVVVHEMEKQVIALMGYVERGDLAHVKEGTLYLKKLISGYSQMIVKSNLKECAVDQIVKTVIDNNYFRLKDHNIRIFSNLKNARYTAVLSRSEAISALNNLIDNSIFWVTKSRMSDRMIYIYITNEENGYITVAVCDNGPGFNIPVEFAVKPFVSGKPLNSGMGLGLYITNQVMNLMNGKFRVCESEELNLPETAKIKGINKAVVALSFPIQ
jgi:signal transduction histidine kinase